MKRITDSPTLQATALTTLLVALLLISAWSLLHAIGGASISASPGWLAPLVLPT